MSVLCSILIPSRDRFDRLARSLDTIYNTLLRYDSVEAVVIMDEDDGVAKARYLELLKPNRNIRVVFGDRRNGWESIDERMMEQVPALSGRWLLAWNDDCTMHSVGGRLDLELAKIPAEFCVAHPASFQNGGSLHAPNCPGVFPAIPMRCWEKHGMKAITHSWDACVEGMVRREHYAIRFMPGIKYIHHWKAKPVLPA